MKILDTTIRDGSYAVDFQFTCKNVSDIVSRLDKLGDDIEYIEIGHGQGLNASSPEHGVGLYSDEEYIDAAVSVEPKAKLGMFCIPGIARLSDLKLAAEHGLNFIRIGVTADDVDKALPFVAEAKRLGLTVMVNFMKTYVFSPVFISQCSQQAYEAGADYIYLVDSAGCMLPNQLGEYIDVIKAETHNIQLGFHGHNNLGMAVANSLLCVNKGVELIDCSFQGLGRSLGNTPTEMFIMTLQKMHGTRYSNMDIPKLLEYGFVSMCEIAGSSNGIKVQSPLDLVCGYTGFHSSFIRQIFKCCRQYEVDPMRLIIAYSEQNQKSLDYKQLCSMAAQLPKDEDVDAHPYSFRKYFLSTYND